MSTFKQQLINRLNEISSILNKNNGNVMPVLQNIINYNITYLEACELLSLLKPNYGNGSSAKYIELNLFYELSQVYDVMLLQKSGILELLLNQNVDTIPSHDVTQDKLVPFIAEFYVKYESRKMKVDLRNNILPTGINIIRYICDENAEYVNLPSLPHKPYDTIQISNSGSDLLKLNVLDYNNYIKIHPKYLYKHRYIKFLHNNRGIEADYIKYFVDNVDTCKSRYCCQITYNNTLNVILNILHCDIIEPGNKDWCFLTREVSNELTNLNKKISYATYKPNYLTNILGEIEEIKQLILPLNVVLKVEFDYR